MLQLPFPSDITHEQGSRFYALSIAGEALRETSSTDQDVILAAEYLLTGRHPALTGILDGGGVSGEGAA